jgi:hypothetical protein
MQVTNSKLGLYRTIDRRAEVLDLIMLYTTRRRRLVPLLVNEQRHLG